MCYYQTPFNFSVIFEQISNYKNELSFYYVKCYRYFTMLHIPSHYAILVRIIAVIVENQQSREWASRSCDKFQMYLGLAWLLLVFQLLYSNQGQIPRLILDMGASNVLIDRDYTGGLNLSWPWFFFYSWFTMVLSMINIIIGWRVL